MTILSTQRTTTMPMTNYTKFSQKKLSMADIIEIEADDYAKRQVKIARKRQRKRQSKGEKKK